MSNVVTLPAPKPDKRYCKDCRFIFRSWLVFAASPFAQCIHPGNKMDDPVFGPRASYLPIGRFPGMPCGPEGKLWEAKGTWIEQLRLRWSTR